MKKVSLLLSFFAVSILLLGLLTGCPKTSPGAGTGGVSYTDGTVTVTISGAGSYDGDDFAAGLYESSDDPETDDPRAVGGSTITGGACSLLLDEFNSPNDWLGSGGVSYHLYCFIDENDNKEPDEGVELVYNIFPIVFTQDGNETIDTLCSEFSTFCSITINITGASAQNGNTAYCGVFNQGDDPSSNDPQAAGDLLISSGSGTDELNVYNSSDIWTGTDGNSYDLYLWIDTDGDFGTGVEEPESGVDLVYNPFPYTFTKDETMSFTFDYADFSVY